MSRKRITVTGGKGFLGGHLVKKMREEKGWPQVLIADLPEFDLRERDGIRRMLNEQKPEVLIHLASVVGGIGANQRFPARFFYENAIMGIQLIHECYLAGIEKFVALGTICCYPKFTPVPFSEKELWNGYPEETNAPYGLAKKMLLVQAQAYRRQYGFNAIFLMPVNLYGPQDNFDPDSSHVIPALIKKVYDAKDAGQDHIMVWGTGRASREFLFVSDAAEGIALAAERYDQVEPVNLGAGFEISIRELVGLIVRLTGFSGKVLWDESKPDGQPRRMLDTSRAAREFGFRAKVGLEEGLRATIAWYESNRRLASSGI